jgi:hypothetical protein
VATSDPEKDRQRLAELYAGMTEGDLQKLADDAGSLTDDAREALTRELLRRGLEIPLRYPSPGNEKPPKLVIVGQYVNAPDALLAKSVLDSADIECFLADENLIRMDWLYSNAIGGIKLLVREEDASAAMEMLDQSCPETFDVEGVGQYRQPSCPNCQSIDVSFEELIKSVAYGSIAATWLAGIMPPIPLRRRGWKCHACGHAWEEASDG